MKTDPIVWVKTRVTQRGSAFVTLYSNDVMIQVTPWDVRLIFGVIEHVTPDGSTATVQEVGDVRLSVSLARRVVDILQAQLTHYEQTIGPIPSPKELLP